MRMYRLFGIGLIVLSLAGLVQGESTTATRLKKLLTDLPDPDVKCGAVVVDLQTGETLVSLSADEPMIPNRRGVRSRAARLSRPVGQGHDRPRLFHRARRFRRRYVDLR
jgi:hypothetical protein